MISFEKKTVLLCFPVPRNQNVEEHKQALKQKGFHPQEMLNSSTWEMDLLVYVELDLHTKTFKELL